ncbi:MAG: tetratricopeptide repeat protein [Candidatus Riflebacteria bacterium]|nr:tetratricopeptide repeat protein [Candidatus Riflebacteria bacterium]
MNTLLLPVKYCKPITVTKNKSDFLPMKSTYAPLLIVWIIGILLSMSTFYPGVMSPDSIDSMIQGETWTFRTTQQPTVMGITLGIANLFIKGPVLILFLQVLFWWTAWAIIIRSIFPTKDFFQAALLLIIGFWPPLFAIIGAIWRDVQMTVTILFAGALMLFPNSRYIGPRLLAATLLATYASGVRLNALPSVLPIAIWICAKLWHYIDKKQAKFLRIAVVASCFVTITCGGKLINSVVPQKSVRMEQYFMLFDLVGISANIGENLVPPPVRNGYDRPEQIKAIYSAFSCLAALYEYTPNVTLPRILTTEDPKIFDLISEAWRKAIISHPMVYFKHRTTAFAALMGWSDRRPYYPYEKGVIFNTLGIKWNPSQVSDKIYSFFDFLLNYFSILWRPWFYIWLTLIISLKAISAWRYGASLPVTFLILLSSWFYTLPYYFVTSAADARYLHWSITATFLAAMTLYYEIRVNPFCCVVQPKSNTIPGREDIQNNPVQSNCNIHGNNNTPPDSQVMQTSNEKPCLDTTPNHKTQPGCENQSNGYSSPGNDEIPICHVLQERNVLPDCNPLESCETQENGNLQQNSNERLNHNAKPSFEITRKSLTETFLGIVVFLIVTMSLNQMAKNTSMDFGCLAARSGQAIQAVEQGEARLKTSDFSNAITFFKNSQAFEPEWWVPEINLSFAYAGINETSSASFHQNKAIMLCPTGEVFIALANHSNSQSKFQDSLIYVGKALNKNCDKYSANLAALNAAIGLRNWPLAVIHTRQCVLLNLPAFSHDIIAVGDPFFKDPLLCEAGLEYFRQLKDIAPDQWWAHYNYGTLALKLGRKSLGEEEYKKAEELKHSGKN